VRRGLLAAAALVIVAWLLAPLPRAYLLVAGYANDPARPDALPVEDVSFNATDGVSLSGWLVRAAPGAPAVVLVHGFKGSRLDMVPWARVLHEAGFNVLLFDTRACGKSGGATVGLGATEPRDISGAVSLAEGAFDTPKVAVIGISLGAGASILAAAADARIAAVVADSAWTDQDIQLSHLDFVPVGPVRFPLPPYGPAAASAMVGADVTKARPLDVIGRIAPRPVFLIHSADDDNATTPVTGARALYEAAGEPKQIWIAPRGGHVGAINAFPDEYRSRLLAFLATSIGPP
jgi:uncharacterized protein